MKLSKLATFAAPFALMAAMPAEAAIQWTDLQNQTAGLVSGQAGGVTVTYTGDYYVAQTSGGTDYWNPFPTGDRPTGTDIIALGNGGLKTINFSQAVSDVYLALNSWNGVSAAFSAPYTVVAQGCGFWGCGTDGGTSPNLFGNGELHGLIKFSGTFNSLSFTDSSEFWHGIQIGYGSIATSGVPEPATWGMMLLGFGVAGSAMRSRRRKVALAA